jgi:ABC-type nitrate/sulfonate/bicarbonate transport system substrate-binding protein
MSELRTKALLVAGLCVALLAATGFLSGLAVAQTAVKIGTSGGLNTAIVPIQFAKSSGLFAKNGLDVQLVDMVDDTTAVQGLIAGEFDMLYTGAGTGMTAIGKGADIKLVDAFSPWTDYQFVTQANIKTLKDMEGNALGVSKIGSLSYLAPVFALEKEGVDVSKIQFVAIGNDAARGRALASKTIQGCVINGVNAVVALKADPTLHIIYDVGTAFRESAVSTAFFARGEAIKNKPQVVQAAVTALIQASRDLQSDKKLAVEQGIKSGLPADAVQGTYDLLFASPVSYYGVDGGINPKAIESTIKLLKGSGDIDKSKNVTVADVVDQRFVDQAMKTLGPYKH